MPIVPINYLAVLVSAIVYFVIGAVWYGPIFGNIWMKLNKLKKEDVKKENMPRCFIGSFIGYLVLCFVLAHFVQYSLLLAVQQSGAAFAVPVGAQTGFWAWLGFTAATSAGTYLYGGKPMKLYVLDNAYHLVGSVVAGIILAVWM